MQQSGTLVIDRASVVDRNVTKLLRMRLGGSVIKKSGDFLATFA